MKLLRPVPIEARARARRGAALLLSLLMLLVLVAIVIQINVSTGTDARMAKNDVTLSAMDLAVESAILQELETLKSDSESDAGAAGGGAAGGAQGAQGAASAAGGAGAAGAAGGQAPASDSRRDEWSVPQRTEINEIKIRVWCVDEDSKYNILNMLNSDPKEADAAYQRVVDILDRCRDGTRWDIDTRTAEEMARTMREFLTKRKLSRLPRPKLLTDDPKNEDLGMPLSFGEFRALPPFEDHHFKDYRDEDGNVVHAITSFLTVWTSLGTAPAGGAGAAGAAGGAAASGNATTGTNQSTTSNQGGSSPQDEQSGTSSTTATSGTSGTSGTQSGGTSGAGGAAGGGSASTSGGYAVNVNTAPVAVLHGLADGRDIPSRFWDKLVEWRNLEDEEEKEKREEAARETGEPTEEKLDEWGQPVITRRIFDSLQKLSEVDGYSDLTGEQQTKLNQLLTTQSQVFSVYVVARKVTSADQGADYGLSPEEMRRREETAGDSLLRVVRAVYWRRKAGDEVVMTPILRWEVLDYLPYEVLDFPPDDR